MTVALQSSSNAAQGLDAALLAHRSQFVQFLRRRGHGAAAEDILHTAYLRLLEHGVSVRDERKLLNWFYAVLRNAAIDHARAATRTQRLHYQAARELTNESAEHEDSACLARTRALVAALEPTYREALETVYLRELPIAELATRSGITRNAAAVRAHRARRALRALVAAQTNEPCCALVAARSQRRQREDVTQR